MGSGILLLVVAAVCLLALPVGLWFVVRGVRGGRVGVLPHCRRCDFELTGNAALGVLFGPKGDGDAVEKQTKCPECGAELLKPDSIRIGAFKRRWFSALAGMLIMTTALLTLGGGVMTLGAASVSSRFVKSSPTWLLDWQLRNAGQASVDAICREVVRRDQAQLVTVADAATLMDSVLACCERPDIAWSASMTSVMNTLELTRGTPMSDGEWGRLFAKGIKSLDVRVRPKVREGAQVPMTLDLKLLSELVKRDMQVSATLVSMRVNGGKWQPVSDQPYFGASISTNSDAFSFQSLQSPTIPAGRHSLELEWELSLRNNNWQDVCAIKRSVTCDIEVVPADSKIIEEIVSPSAEVLKRKITLSEVSVHDFESNGRMGQQSSGYVNFRSFDTMVPGAFEVYLLIPNTAGETEHAYYSEWYTGNDRSRRGSMYSYSQPPSVPWSRVKALDKIDVLLKSSTPLAENTMDMTSCWQGEILYKDVPVNVLYPGGRRSSSPKALSEDELVKAAINKPYNRRYPYGPSDEADELLSRIEKGTLSDKACGDLLSQLLERQRAAIESGDWFLSYGSIIEALILNEKATQEQASQFFRQIMAPLKLSPPTRAWEGRESYVTISHPPYRSGEKTDATMEMETAAIRVDGVSVAVQEPARKRHLIDKDWQTSAFEQTRHMQRPIKLPAFVSAGDKMIEVDYRVRVWKGAPDQVGSGLMLHEQTYTLSVGVHVLAKNDLDIRLETNHMPRSALIDAWNQSKVSAFVLVDAEGKTGLGGVLSFKTIPIAVAFDVYFRPPNSRTSRDDVLAGQWSYKRYQADSSRITFNFGDVKHATKLNTPVQLPTWFDDAKQVLIVLRPNHRYGAERLTETEMLGGDDIVLGPVDLTRVKLLTK